METSKNATPESVAAATAVPQPALPATRPRPSLRARFVGQVDRFLDWLNMTIVAVLMVAFYVACGVFLFSYLTSLPTSQPAYYSRPLSAGPIEVAANGHTNLYGWATVNLQDGGWAALTIHNSDGASVGGLVIMAGKGDPCAATKWSDGWACRNVQSDVSETFDLLADNQPRFDPGVPSLTANERTEIYRMVDLDLARRLLGQSFGIAVDAGTALPHMSLSGGIWLTGEHGRVLMTAGWPDGTLS